jgi:hypothetical protein
MYAASMTPLGDYFPRHVWLMIFVLLSVAVLGLFVPPSMTAKYGLSITEHVVAIGSIKFAAAVGIGGLVVVYRDTDSNDDSDWRFDP